MERLSQNGSVAEQLNTLGNTRQVAAYTTPIVEIELLDTIIIVVAAVARVVEVQVASARNISEGNDIPRKALRALLADLYALAGSGIGVVFQLDALEVEAVAVLGDLLYATVGAFICCELDDGAWGGRGRDAGD